MQDYLDRLVEQRLQDRYALNNEDVDPYFQQTPSVPSQASSKPGYVDYYDYISSSRWKRRKAAYYANHPRICRACRSRDDIHLHHHTYVRLGHEHDDDLVPLCKTCHDEVHLLHKSGSASLTAVTKKFVTASGGVFSPPRRRMSQKRKKGRADGPRPGFWSPEQVALFLHVRVVDLPAPKQKKMRDKGHFRASTVQQWAFNQHPAWLVEAWSRNPVPEVVAGQRVTVSPTVTPALSWAVGKTGTVVAVSGTIGTVELDDTPGSRLAVTARMIRPA